METILTLGGISLPAGSARGISQTLAPAQDAELARTVNGTLVDLTNPLLRKLRTEISCTDQDRPAFADLWPGNPVTIGCIAALGQAVSPAATVVTLVRDPVAGSLLGYDADGNAVALQTLDGRSAVFAAPVSRVNFRPVLACRLVSRRETIDEYAAEVGWSLVLEEV